MESNGKKRSDTLFWGAILIWAGLVFAAESFGMLPRIGGAQAWTWVLLGAGVLALGINLWRVTSEDMPNPETWDWIFTAFFLLGGLSGFGFNFDLAWPVILIIIGVGMLGNVMLQKK
jgi:hypothetical protein